MSESLRDGAFEALDMEDCKELTSIRDALDPIRQDVYGGHDTAHPEIRDTPESLYRLRKHAMRPDMSENDRNILFENVKMMHSLYSLLYRDMKNLLTGNHTTEWTA